MKINGLNLFFDFIYKYTQKYHKLAHFLFVI